MAPSTKQVRLPFDAMTESGLKPVLKKFEKQGLKISKIESTNTAKRESGYLLKDATFNFEDGQKMLIRVKSDGTVFQVKLNTKVVPIRHVDDMDKAIIEMVDYVQSNATAYSRTKIQTEKRKKLNMDTPVIHTSRQEKLEKAQAALAEIQGTNEELEQQAVELDTSASAKSNSLTDLLARLQAEKDKTTVLQAELDALMKQEA